MLGPSQSFLVGLLRSKIFQRLLFCMSVLDTLADVVVGHHRVLIFNFKQHGLDVGVYHLKVTSVTLQSNDIELHPFKGLVGCHAVTCNEYVYE